MSQNGEDRVYIATWFLLYLPQPPTNLEVYPQSYGRSVPESGAVGQRLPALMCPTTCGDLRVGYLTIVSLAIYFRTRKNADNILRNSHKIRTTIQDWGWGRKRAPTINFKTSSISFDPFLPLLFLCSSL
jgi:hypothetical protein